ncbi:MAG: phytase, partial [Phaeodactylibacter sp.]|nr:phytase [Phaeodactylibacter sp.]
RVDLLGGSNRSDQSVDLFLIDPQSGKLTDIAAASFQVDTTVLDDVYGFCFYKNPASGAAYVFINAKNGRVRQYKLLATEAGKIDLEFKRDMLFESQVEGMVADDARGILYVGEEDRGIWKMSADPKATDQPVFISMSGEDNAAIRYDVEGLSLYLQDTTGYLIASSQGNFSYAVFERNGDNAYLGSFKILEKGDIDGVEETDGIQAVNVVIDSLYPAGLFIVQDGFNVQGAEAAAQNFKVVDWREIEAALLQQSKK